MDNSKPGLSPNLDVFLSAILEDYVPAAAATTFARELLGESDRTDAAAFARALCGESDPREAAAFAYELLRESDPARRRKFSASTISTRTSLEIGEANGLRAARILLRSRSALPRGRRS